MKSCMKKIVIKPLWVDDEMIWIFVGNVTLNWKQ